MATYQKLNDCPQTFTISKHNAVIDSSVLTVTKTTLPTGKIRYSYILDSEALLSSTAENVYIGFSDDDGNFKGNNTASSISLDSDTSGCSATATKEIDIIGSDGYNTASLIKYTLNKCTADRTITFSYNSIPIFKIKQTYETTTVSTTSYVYGFYISSFSINSDYQYAWFDNNSPSTISVTNTNKYLMYYYDDLENYRSYIFLYYTNKMYTFATDLTVSDIKSELTHVSGNDSLGSYGSYYYLDVPYNVNSYNNGNPTTVSASESSTICLYRYQSNVFIKIATITINDDTASYHLGKYKYVKL